MSGAPELWKPVPGWPDYDVSDQGRVMGPRGRVNPYRDSDGYLRIGVGKTSLLLHRAVAGAFMGPCPAGHEVAHRNHDRADARLSNLEYLTHADNVKATAAAGRSMRGETHVAATITEETAKAILAEYRPLTQRTGRSLAPHGMAALARKHNTTLRVVRGIIHGETWKHLPRSSPRNPKDTGQ